MESQRAVILRGNPADGFEVIGPFPASSSRSAKENAALWAADPKNEMDFGGDWWILPLEAGKNNGNFTLPKTPADYRIEIEALAHAHPATVQGVARRNLVEEAEVLYEKAVVEWMTELYESWKDNEMFLGDRAAAVAHTLAYDKCLGGNEETVWVTDEDQLDRFHHIILVSTVHGPEGMWAFECVSTEAAKETMRVLQARVNELQKGYPQEVLPN